MGLMGDLAVRQDTCRVDSSGQVLSDILLKSAVTSGAGTTALRLHRARKNSAGPECGPSLLVRRLIQSDVSTTVRKFFLLGLCQEKASKRGLVERCLCSEGPGHHGSLLEF